MYNVCGGVLASYGHAAAMLKYLAIGGAVETWRTLDLDEQLQYGGTY